MDRHNHPTKAGRNRPGHSRFVVRSFSPSRLIHEVPGVLATERQEKPLSHPVSIMRMPSRIEWSVVVTIVVVVIALVPPTRHWRETTSESCHLCGNCRDIVHIYRWWQLDSEQVIPTLVLPVPEGHPHDWWQCPSSYVSYNKKWASSKASRYRDGRLTWTPGPD